jgi:ketosteroid isomerase-like protein
VVLASGETVQHLCAICRFKDGLVTEETVYYDQLERVRLIGAVLEVDGQPMTLPQQKN